MIRGFNDLEENEIFGLDAETYLKYQNNHIPLEKVMEMTPKEAKKVRISKSQLYRYKKAIRNKKFKPRRKTLLKLSKL